MWKIVTRKLKEIAKIGSRPDFFIIGAQKYGTTSLYDFLTNASNDIKPAISKELRFFTERNHRGSDFYKSLFPIFKGKSLTGEATPDYFYYHRCPQLVYDYNPEAKVIIILRDPVQRAFSQYSHQNYTWKTHASDPMPFSKAIREEESRFHVDELSKFYYDYKYYSYKSRGLYYKQLCNWLKYFELGNIHIVFLEDFKEKPKDTIREILSFLGVKPFFENLNFPIKNKSPDSAIKEADQRYLREFFREDSTKLFELLGEQPRWELN
jgi:hypothetical protein